MHVPVLPKSKLRVNMHKVLLIPRKNVEIDAALRTVVNLAGEMDITVTKTEIRSGARMLIVEIKTDKPEALKRFTMTLREVHKPQFTSVSRATKV